MDIYMYIYKVDVRVVYQGRWYIQGNVIKQQKMWAILSHTLDQDRDYKGAQDTPEAGFGWILQI